MSCKSQNWRSSKFIHRFQKLIGDALWHVESTKKCAINRINKRGKREANGDLLQYDEIIDDYQESSYHESMITGEYDDFQSLQYNYEDFVNTTKKTETAINEENEITLARARGSKRPQKNKNDEKTKVN